MKNVQGQNMRPSKSYGYRKLGNLNKKSILGQPNVFAPVKDVTEDYKKSLLTKKLVEVKSRFPNTDTKLWEPQPKRVYIGRGAKNVKVYQYVSAKE
jgi:hypothetical protein